MTTEGWLLLIGSCFAIILLVAYCFYKVLTLPGHEEEDLHGPLDIDTHDVQEP